MNFPSVTAVINPWTDFSKIPPAVLQHASERGTEVHSICTRFACGEFVVASPECQPYLDSFTQWFDLMVDKVLLCEVRLAHEGWGYHGQEDIYCRLKDGRTILADLKTPVALQKSWRVQLSAYRELLVANDYNVACVGSLRLSPAGKMAKMDFYENSPQDFNMFVQALNLYRFFNS